jgi:O-antigen/teichoic acid export membrane protein/SAM-dependent methyltransferase/tRNA A-37 threonylcarbamoyl transferase component Bud32
MDWQRAVRTEHGDGVGLTDTRDHGSLVSGRTLGLGLGLALARTGPAIAQFGIIFVVARIGDPHLVGLLSLGAVVAQYVATFVDFGGGDLFLLRVGQGHPEWAYSRAVLRSKVPLSLGAVSLVVALAVGLGIPWPLGVAAAFAGTAGGFVPWLTARLIVRGRSNREVVAAWTEGCCAVGATLALLASGHEAAWEILTAVGACRWLGNLVRFVVGGLDAPGGAPTGSTPRATVLFREARPFFLSAAIQAVFLQVDVLLLFALAGPSAVGVYQLAWRLVYFAGVAAESLVAILLPRVARGLRRGQAPSSVLRQLMVGFGALGAAVAAAVWVVVPRVLVAVFGPDFEASAPLARILAVALGFRFFAYAAGLLLTASDHQQLKFKASVVYTLISTGVFAIGASVARSTGVAFARIAAEILVLLSYVRMLQAHVLRAAPVPPPVAQEGFFGEVEAGRLASAVRRAERGATDSAVEQLLSESLGVDWSDRESLDSVKPTALAPIAHLLDGARVLDAGCGLGAITRWIGWAGARVVGVDAVHERALVARRRLDEASVPGLGVVIADVTRLPVASNSMDIVTCTGVLEWIPVVARGAHARGSVVQVDVLREFARVLRPGGLAVIAIENRYGLPYLLGRRDEHTALRWVTVLPRPVAERICRAAGRRLAYTHSIRGMRRLAREAGLDVEDVYAVLPHYSCATLMISTGPHWRTAIGIARRIAPVASGRSGMKRWAWRLALGSLSFVTRRLAPSLVVVMKAPSAPGERVSLPLVVVGARGAGRAAHAVWVRDAGAEVTRIPMSPRASASIQTAVDVLRTTGEASLAHLLSRYGVCLAGPRSLTASGDLVLASSELVEGENVSNLLARGSWQRRRALAVAVLRRLASVAAYMPHHGDLSPVNLFLTSDGQLTVLDWETSSGGDPQGPEAAAVDLSFLGTALANFVEPGRVGTTDPELWVAPWETNLWRDVRAVWSEAELALGLRAGTIESLSAEVLTRARERQRKGLRTPLTS